MTSLLRAPKFSVVDDNGNPASGWKVYFYEDGTSTPKDTYADRDKNATNANPVVLDSRGEATIYGEGSYKIVVKDADDATKYTVDNYEWPIDIDSSGDVTFQNNVTISGDLTLSGGLTADGYLLSEIKALTAPSTDGVFVYANGRTSVGDGFEGWFYWDSSDLSTEVTNDTQNGIYIPPNSDSTGASGAWVRQDKYPVKPKHYGALGDGTPGDDVYIQAGVDLIEAEYAGGGLVELDFGKTYKLSSGVTLTNQNWFFGIRGGQNQMTAISTDNDIDLLTVSGARATVEGFKLTGPGSGSHTRNGLLLSDKYHVTRNVRVDNVDKGVHAQDIVMSLWEGVLTASCATGFKVDTAATSLTANSCFDNGSTIGWDINSLAYSTLNSCGTDNNTDGWILKGCKSLTMNACGCEGSATEAISITDGCRNVTINGFLMHKAGNVAGGHSGAVIDVTDGSGQTANVTINGLRATGDASNRPTNIFNINCTGPVWIRNFLEDTTAHTGDLFENADGLAEYAADWTATVTQETSGTVTLNSDTLRVERRGNKVTLYGILNVDSVSSPSGSSQIDLPFTVANATKAISVASVLPKNVPFTGNGVQGLLNQNTALLKLVSPQNDSTLASVTLDADSAIYIYAQYETDDAYTIPTGMSVSSIELLE